MSCSRAAFWAALVLMNGQAISQTTPCDTNLKYGGSCIGLRDPCPAGTFEYQEYSNYIGCSRVDQKCCAGNSDGPVKNPSGITPIQPRTCGRGSLEPSVRILDGTITGHCDWPFAVSIRSLNVDGSPLTYDNTIHICQGVLIDKWWVLTSPYCVLAAGFTLAQAPSKILISIGDYNVSGIDIDPITRTQREQLVVISSIHLHPDYKLRSREDIFPNADNKDINGDGVALIKLSQPITGPCAGIACLPTATEAANKCATYDDCVIVGWGYDTEGFDNGPKGVPLIGHVRLSSSIACDLLTQRMGLINSRFKGSACKTPKERNIDSCPADEGGAVYCASGDSWVVRGILPFNLCTNGEYNMYVTDIAPYLPWIESTVASGSAGLSG